MNRSLGLRVLSLLFPCLALPPLALATPSFSTTAPWNAVTTYQSIGLYWKPTGASAQQKAMVRFREMNASGWRDGHELWFDARNAEYRGSLVELKPGTVYDIQLKLGTGAWTDTTASCDTVGNTECKVPATSACTSATRTQCTRTWDEAYRVKERRLVTSQTSRYDITEGGNETEGYIVYEGAPGNNTITLTEGSGHCVLVDAKFVVVRNLVLEGCGQDGIRLHSVHSANTTDGTRRAASDVIIEDNEIRGWGRKRSSNPDLATDLDSGIRCDNAAETGTGNDDNNRVHRVVIQRNNIHSPRYTANPWRLSATPSGVHPGGAQAVTFSLCGRNHVIRYNDVYSTPDLVTGVINHFNDGFGGAKNFGGDAGQGGFPWADSDIYGNRISHVFDDGIEAEGDNRNVRIWANYFDHVFVGIGNAATAKGPLYVWRNVTNWMANMNCTGCNSDLDDPRGELIKGGGKVASYNGGIAYYYHNTMLQPPPPAGKSLTMGGGFGILTEEADGLYNFVSRNNVWHIHDTTAPNDGILPDYSSIRPECIGNPCSPPTPDNGPAADYDLYNGRLFGFDPTPSQEPHGIGRGTGSKTAANDTAVPTYVGGGRYPLSANIPGTDNEWSGDFSLASTSLGANNAGVAIPNFNDLTGRNVGAQPNTGRMRFGSTGATGVESAAAQIPVLDDFEDGDAVGWTPSGVHSWSVDATTKVFRQSDMTGTARAALDASNWMDQMIEADVTIESTDAADRWAALFVRHQDIDNTYYITLRTSGVLSLRKLVNGGVTVLANHSMPVTLGTRYRLRLEVVGQTLKAYVDGTQVLTATDTAHASGRAAIGTFHAVASFDNVLVTPTPLDALGWLQDNFKDGDAAGWNQIGANPWSVAPSNGNNVLRQSDTAGGYRAIRAESYWRDQSVEADVTITGAGASGSIWGGLFVRFTDLNNTYYVTLRPGTNPLNLRKIVGGVITDLAFLPSFVVAVNRTYKVRLEASGANLKVYVDGNLLLQAIDTTFAAGRAGVGTNRASAEFDNIVVSARAPTVMSDNFEDGDANGWTPGGTHSWSVVLDGALVYKQSNGTSNAFSTLTGTSPEQAIQARVKALSFTAPDNWVGLAARYADFNNHYYITARSGTNELHLKKTVGGVFSTLASVPFTVSTGLWYKFRLEVLGAELRVYVDIEDGAGWKLLIDVTDPTPLTAGGNFGIRMFGATAEYDDVVVTTP